MTASDDCHKEGTSLLIELAQYLKMNKEIAQFTDQPHLFWEFAEDSMSELAPLGHLLISISPQGADLERVFSASGIFHNASRNRLSHIKAEKMVRVKADMLAKNPRRKRHSKAKIKTSDAESAEVDAALDEVQIEDEQQVDGDSSEDEQEEIEAELNHDDEGDVDEDDDMADAAVEAIDISLSALFDVQFQYGTLFTRFDARDVNK